MAGDKPAAGGAQHGDLAALGGLIAALKQRAGTVGIAVVGSFARGEVRPGSDIDIVVLTDAGGRPTVEGFEYAGRPAEVLSMPEGALRAELANPRRGSLTIPIWAGGRVLHDTGERLATLLAEIEARHQDGPAPMAPEEREYARVELAHAYGLIEEAGARPDLEGQATCRLLIVITIRSATEVLLRQARRWPVGLRATVPTLRTLDATAADLAERALVAGASEAVAAALALIERVQRQLGGPLQPGP